MPQMSFMSKPWKSHSCTSTVPRWLPKLPRLMCEETAQGSERQEVRGTGGRCGDWLSQGAKIVRSDEKNSVAVLPGRRWNIKLIDFQ